MAKTHQCTQQEVEALAWFERNAKVRELEMRFWAAQADEVRQTIMKRCGVDQKTEKVDWNNVYENGKITTEKLKEDKEMR